MYVERQKDYDANDCAQDKYEQKQHLILPDPHLYP
jgi:hypothetical protein